MELSEIAIKCHACCVHFTPSEDRAKRLMKEKLCISLCKECEEQEEAEFKTYMNQCED